MHENIEIDHYENKEGGFSCKGKQSWIIAVSSLTSSKYNMLCCCVVSVLRTFG